MSESSVDALAEEREALRETVRSMLERTSPESEVRRLMETESGYDEAVWKQLSEQLGLTGLAIPEEYGGSGMGPMELAVVFEEFGRAMYSGPFFATVALAANLLMSSSDEAMKKEWLPRIAAGETLATVAFTEASSVWDLDGVATTATADGDGWKLNGTKWFIIDGTIADLILVIAKADDGPGIFVVPGESDGLTREAMVTMDQTRKMARLTFEGVSAQRLNTSIGETLTRGRELAAVALSAENVGGAQRCLEMTSAYANERAQFGRPIGSFQAIKHKLANMLIAVEQAKSASYFAAREAANDGDDLALAASLAKAYTSDSFYAAAADTIQIHGGIGFTWEHSAHLYFKRAKTNQLLLGSSSHHRGIVADLVGI